MALICWARWGPPDHVSDFTTLLPIRTSSLSRGTSNEDRAAKKWASPSQPLVSVSADAEAAFKEHRTVRMDDSTLAVERAAHRRLRRGLCSPRRAAEASAGADVHRAPLAAHET